MSEGFEIIAQDGLPDAEPDTEHRIGGAFPNPAVALSPVIPLGFTGAKVSFAMPEGEIRHEVASKIGSMLRIDIYACQAGQAFLTHWRDEDGKFQRDLASVWFVRKCREAGLWNSKRQERGLGVWPGEAGGVVLHRGAEIWTWPASGKMVKTTVVEALRNPKGPLYRLRPTAPAPARPAAAAEGQWLRQHLDHWRFEALGEEGLTGADIVAGWTMAALLGAVAPFRAHLMVDALAGSGKTTLMHFVAAVMAAHEVEVIDAFTPAGLKNDLAGQARPVLIDEAESSPGGQHGPGPVETALKLLRSMSTGMGGTRKQGDIGGGTVTQTAVGAVMMAAISPPRLGAADASRIVELRLLPLSAGVGSSPGGGQPPGPLATDAALEAARLKAEGLAPALLGRALSGAARYRSDVGEVKAALGRLRESPRTADLIAMLAAGRRLLLFDEALTPAAAEEEARLWRPLLTQREALDQLSNPGADCLAFLLNADSGQHVRDRRETLGDLVTRWIKKERDYDDALKSHGVKLWEGDPSGQGLAPRPWLVVANQHPGLTAIFTRSAWPDWRRNLTHLDALGAEYATRCSKNSEWFGLKKSRALYIPLTPWIESFARPAGTGGGGGVPTTVPEEDLVWQ